MRIPFGKHKGKQISKVPAGYLAWILIEEGGTDSWALNAAIGNELVHRLNLRGYKVQEVEKTAVKVLPTTVESLFSNLCKKYHPDKKGCQCGEGLKALVEFRGGVLYD